MPEKILIIDDDVDTLRLVGLMLQRQGYQITSASNGSQGLTKAEEDGPDLILLDVMMPDMDGYEVTRRLRKNPVTATIPILMFTAKTQLDDKVTGFEVGADDYLTKPTHPTELQAHVKALLARAVPKDNGGGAPGGRDQHGYIVGVISVRSGMGVSSLSANVATGLYNQLKSDVILAELTPGQGTLGMELGEPNQKGLTEMLRGRNIEITRDRMKSLLVPHNSGVKLFLSSENPRDVDLVSEVKNFETVAARLASLARFVILDLGAGLPTSTQKLLLMCNERFVVVEGTQSSVLHTKILIDEIVSLGIDKSTLHMVLTNRQRSEGQMSLKQVQEQLGYPVAATINPAPELFAQASRLHTPAVLAQPSNVTAQQFLKIADSIIEREKVR